VFAAAANMDPIEQRFAALERLLEERDRRYSERFEAQDAKTAIAMTASQEAIAKAERATEARFQGVNEFRATLSDQASTFIPRLEAMSALGVFDEKIETVKLAINDLKLSRSEHAGAKATSSVTTERIITIAIATAAIASGIVQFLLRSMASHP
jgi:hypothetical protein